MLIALTDEEAAELKARQIKAMASVLRTVMRSYPGIDPWALTDTLMYAERDYGLIEPEDGTEVRIQAVD